MPLYTISTQRPLSSVEQQMLVSEITEVHCTVTGAPAQFVQVVFSQGVYLRSKNIVHVLGSIRSGRSDKIKSTLANGFIETASKVLGCPTSRCEVDLIDVPASWVIEGGAVMPEPGEEQEWLALQSS
ncbi:tautomerase family protein [Microbulbifer echini]|uniref:Tautomerase family protein n=1 Tax=Microbulbifer echini TaxID=1529067 RepID=A0ABV4NTR5_9GAMM|nr:tautomerase family protein [uncultured Microbulbifer sp.]